MDEYIAVGLVNNMTTSTVTIYGLTGMQGLLSETSLTEVKEQGKCLIINLRPADEKFFAENGIPTISLPVLLSIAGECSFNTEEISGLLQKAVCINYKNIFLNERESDFSVLFYSSRFWRKIAGIVCECLEMIHENGLINFLLLETEVTPILHQMFDGGFPLDVIGVRKECRQMKDALSIAKNRIKTAYEDELDLSHLCLKLEDKLRRIPFELFNNGQKEIRLFCNFRSLGSDTFRITTNHVNLQGLPKEIRKYLLPRYGEVLTEYDLVSSQLVILAYLSGENSLMKKYENGIDLYLFVISVMTGKSVDDITQKERNAFKKMVLQMLYGAGKTTILKELQANEVNVSYTEMAEMQVRFYQNFKGIKIYSLKVKEADKLLLPDGRRWNLKESVDGYKRLAYVLQYVESLILRKTLVLLEQEIRDRKIWIYLCIHDSVFVESELREYLEVKSIVQRCFDTAMKKYLKGFVKTNLKEEIIYHEQIKRIINGSKEE